MIPAEHQNFVDSLAEILIHDAQYVGLAAGSSWIDGQMDHFSDVDLVIVHKADFLSLSERKSLAGSAGNLLAGFTGEHVGEPRLLICLYDDPLLHVDLKFVSLSDMHTRVEDPVIIWERDEAITAVLQNSGAEFPHPDYQWIEDRFWVWIHYAAAKIGRGELFETLTFISFMQQNVLGPLALIKNGYLPKGVRKLEMHLPESDLLVMQSTLARYDRSSCLNALYRIVDYYKTLREAVMPDTVERNLPAERRVMLYLKETDSVQK
ncbi:aminoglycoside 6-adenylyltransferase [Dyadobacter sediminis]|uniref:Oxalate:formate antiporter n=1 Tax=Dyadobacter sediminis TaxID=1493691 RepID=A0A5R9KKB5_9BACT|nr:aminoglycoside 6-adenylyltransferase [Dyadobacter sediminis]TLU96668.1 oxalate:formate antiporter [Dyadobacter sediminis]GGB84177.1 oxalate:formate antiporter [Dyadobacter sediminis]